MGQNFSDFAFTPSVKEAQEHYGSRSSYARMENGPVRYFPTNREKNDIRRSTSSS